MWTLESALAMCRLLEALAEPAGWHIALGGSVLRDGASSNDLDLIAYPRNKTTSLYEDLEEVLHDAGFRCTVNADEVHEFWRAAGSTDTKHVEVWRGRKGRRIDVFVLA